MAVAVAFVPATAKALQPVAVNITGGAASTQYGVTIGHTTGGKQIVVVQTDGTGAASFTHVPQGAGKVTVDVRPITEHTATTTAAASATLVSGGNS
jgi:hypothetical protein